MAQRLLRRCGHGLQQVAQVLVQAGDEGVAKGAAGIVVAQRQARAEVGRNRQREMGLFATLHIEDAQARVRSLLQRLGQRVVLEYQQGVEQIAQPCQALHLGQRTVLVLAQVRFSAWIACTHCATDCPGSGRAITGRVLMNRPNCCSMPGRSTGRPATVAPKATQACPL